MTSYRLSYDVTKEYIWAYRFLVLLYPKTFIHWVTSQLMLAYLPIWMPSWFSKFPKVDRWNDSVTGIQWVLTGSGVPLCHHLDYHAFTYKLVDLQFRLNPRYSKNTSWLIQCLSSRFLKVLIVSAVTTSFGQMQIFCSLQALLLLILWSSCWGQTSQYYKWSSGRAKSSRL